jgi:hypothetical protein
VTSATTSASITYISEYLGGSRTPRWSRFILCPCILLIYHGSSRTLYLSPLVEPSYQSAYVTAFVRPRTLNFTFLLVLSPLAKRIPDRPATTIDSAPTRAVSVSTQTTNQSPQAWPHTLKGITMLSLSNLFNMTIFMSVNLTLILLLSNLLQTTWDRNFGKTKDPLL